MEANNGKPGINPSNYLASERTFLAWMRTSIALMGFVLVKFLLFYQTVNRCAG